MPQDLSERQERILAKMYEYLFGVNRDYAPGQFIVTPREAKERLNGELKTLKKFGYVQIWENEQGQHPDHWELTEAGYNLGKTLMWTLL